MQLAKPEPIHAKPLLRIVAVCLATASPYLTAHSADSVDKRTAPPKPVLLPGEYPVTIFDLARGSGTKWRSCIGHTTFGPGITPEDLEVTYVKENSVKISIKGTEDALICGGFYVPALRHVAHQSIFRFYDANRWSFEDIDKRANLRALAPAAPAGRSPGAPAPRSEVVPAPSTTQITKCAGRDGKITYTEGPCPEQSTTRQSERPGTPAGNVPALPTLQRGLWKLKVNRNGSESQSDYCGNPLENVAAEIARIPEMHKMGCSARTTSSAPRNFSMIMECPADRVSEDGSRRVQKGQSNLSVVSPTPQSFSLSLVVTASNHREKVQGVRVGNCE